MIGELGTALHISAIVNFHHWKTVVRPVLALVLGSGLLIAVPRLDAQGRSDQKILASPRDLAAGAAIYRSNCARCHGRSGRGALGPDLTTGRFRHAVDNDAMFNVINDGISGTDMPAFYWLRSEVAIRQLMGY